RASTPRMCQNRFRHSHCPRIRWSRQLQGTQRGRLKLMEQSSEQVPLIRNIFGPGWCLTRVDDEFRQEGVDVQDATFSGKLADIPRSEVKSPHGNGSRHRNAMNGPRWYPHCTSWRNNPESLLRLMVITPLEAKTSWSVSWKCSGMRCLSPNS